MVSTIFSSGKDPVPIRCPVAGAFNFTQEGDFKFITRYIGGITKDPRHDVWGRTGQFSCKQNISRMAICGELTHSSSIAVTEMSVTDKTVGPCKLEDVLDPIISSIVSILHNNC